MKTRVLLLPILFALSQVWGGNPAEAAITQLPASLTIPATDVDGSYSVSWAASADAGVSYALEESTDAAFAANLRTACTGTALTAPIVGRSNAITYYYRIKATNTGYADSDWLAGANGCSVAFSAVNPSLNITVPANDANGNSTVTWKASTSTAVTYLLEEATDAISHAPGLWSFGMARLLSLISKAVWESGACAEINRMIRSVGAL
jgi:hypothetical protein